MAHRSPHKMHTDDMASQPPTLNLVVPANKAYGMTLQQTKLVYDQLLADKHAKLYQTLLGRKAEYDAKCTELASKDKDRALEFGVRAQEALNKLCMEYDDELTGLKRDYQDKLNKMYVQLDEKAKSDQKQK